MTARTTTHRMAVMRAARIAAGLVRVEVYAHPDDRAAIQALAALLQRQRQAAAAPA